MKITKGYRAARLFAPRLGEEVHTAVLASRRAREDQANSL